MPKTMLLLALAFVGFIGAAANASVRSEALATVTVNPDAFGRTIPSGFDGFSIEVDDSATRYLGVAGSPNLVFYQLLENLGPSVIRIGGASTDYSCWNPAGAPHPNGCSFTISQDALSGYFNASAATGWGLIVGVNLAQNDPAWALDYGAQVVAANQATPGSRLLGFEFGNEPDLFPLERFYDHVNIRPRGYSWPDVVRDWNGYVTAFKSGSTTSGVPLIGPAYDDASSIWKDSYLAPFIDGVGAGNLGTITLHDYPTNVCGGRHVTISQLLAPALVGTYVARASGWLQVTSGRGLPLVLGETNSTACSGEDGVDNVFAATAWGLDWLFVNFNAGMQRINFHMDADAFYDAVHVTPIPKRNGQINYANQVEPLYYAMYAFNSLAQGARVLATAVDSDANVSAYAVRPSLTGPVRVFVINKDLNAAGAITVKPSHPLGNATLLVIRAASLASNDVTYGGVKFLDQTGKLSGTPQTTPVRPNADGSYTFGLANASIAILTANSAR